MEGTPRKVIAKEDWEKKIRDVKIRKDDMNKLVMEFFITEGYESAAVTFHRESGTELETDRGTASARAAVRRAIHSGELENAFEILVFSFPKVLDENTDLQFYIQLQRLIELIRAGDKGAALNFCREYVTPLSEDDPNLLKEMKRAVSLLAYANPFSGHASDLLDRSRILKLATVINDAILSCEGHSTDPKLSLLIKLLAHTQHSLLVQADFPFMILPMDQITRCIERCNRYRL